MKAIVVISEDKQALLDRLLGNGVTVQEISRLLGMNPETLREKLKRRKRGDPNWHNRARVDHRGAYQKMLSEKKLSDKAECDRDDVRIALFDLTKSAEGVTVAEAMRATGYAEAVCVRELDDFCKRPRRSDVESICRKDGNRYFAIGWQTNGNRADKTIDIVQIIGGAATGRRKFKASNSNW
jgi:hypothetical protein